MARRLRGTLLGVTAVVGLGVLPTSTMAATEPIKIMLTAPVNSPLQTYPELVATIQAGVKAINKAGGINGVPVQLEFCDNSLNVNKVQQCAQEAVQKKVVALVGTYVQVYAPGLYPTIEAAKIPNISTTGATPLDWTSKLDFMVSDPFSYVGGAAYGLAKAGCKNIAGFGYAGPAFDVYVAIGERAAKLAGAKYNRVRMPTSTTDWTQPVQQAINNGSDCIHTMAAANTIPGLVRAVKASGKKLRIGMNQPVIDNNISVIGKGLEGAIASSPTVDPTLNPGKDAPALMKLYAAQMKAGGVTNRKQATVTALTGWLDLQLFVQAAKKIPKGKVTSATLLSQLNKQKFSPTGISGTTDFTKPGPLSGADRIKNLQIYIKQVINGRLTLRKKGGTFDLNPVFKGVDYTQLK